MRVIGKHGDNDQPAKRKMQNVHFNSVEEFLEFLPEDELKVVRVLRNLMLECMPGCTEKLSFNVPYYKRHSNICFIWPGSVSWGNVQNKGVRLGFTKGYLMQDEINYLDKGDRKQVYWKDYYEVKDIDVDLLKAYVFEAVEIDHQVNSEKKSKNVNNRNNRK
jgi:hypothetical protein